MDNLYIVIPAYNEEANIETVINDWYPVIEKIGNGSKLVIIDDGSKDSTYKKMLEAQKSKPLFEPITKPNGGHGATVLYGYQYALQQGADYIFQTDSDGQTLPGDFEAFWNLRHDNDMVIGHRKGRQDGSSRVMVTKVLKWVLLCMFGVNIKDANTPFRLMKSSTLKQYIDYIPEGYNLSNVILSVIYKKKRLKMTFLPITFRPRQGGVNSINFKRIVRIGKKALKDFYVINRTLKKIH